MKARLTVFCLLLGFMALFAQCNMVDENPDTKPKAIPLSQVKVELPNIPGVQLVESNCSTCHSLRYIETQPNMSRKAWDKVVKKMVKNFGAPIPDTNVVNHIIDYLTIAKGKS